MEAHPSKKLCNLFFQFFALAAYLAAVANGQAFAPSPLFSYSAALGRHAGVYSAPAVAPYSYRANIPQPVPAVPYAAAPVAPVAPVARTAPVAPVAQAVAPPAVTSSQYHAQDEFGRVSYGYENANSRKEERRDEYGNVAGSYSYVDSTGVPKTVSYIADAAGFRLTGANNLPLHVAPLPAVARAAAAHLAYY